MLSSLIGAAICSAIDGADGDDSTLDVAIGGMVVRALVPVVLTYATGWLVLHGISKAKDTIFEGGKPS